MSTGFVCEHGGGHLHHVRYNPPEVVNLCPKCHSKAHCDPTSQFRPVDSWRDWPDLYPQRFSASRSGPYVLKATDNDGEIAMLWNLAKKRLSILLRRRATNDDLLAELFRRCPDLTAPIKVRRA